MTKLPLSVRSPGCGSCSRDDADLDAVIRLALDELLEACRADLLDGELLLDALDVGTATGFAALS